MLLTACCRPSGQELLGTGTLSVSGAELAALRRFICHQCREEFRNQAIYRVHLQFCRPPPYACELCDAQLPSGRQLVAHKMTEHRCERRATSGRGRVTRDVHLPKINCMVK